jgi:RNA-binding protein of the Puf family, translational repressor
MLKKFVLGGMVVVAALLGNACGDDGSSYSPAGPANSEVTLSSSSDDVIPGNSSSSSVTESPSTSSGQAPQSAESDMSSSSEKTVGGSSSSDGKSSSSSDKIESSSSGKGEKSSSSLKVEFSSSAKTEVSSSSTKTEPSSSSVKTEKSSSSKTSANPCKTETKDNCKYGLMPDAIGLLTVKTVVIGSQTWSAQNVDNPLNGSYCYYSNESYCDKYGRFYMWTDASRVCPRGWHLPSKSEFETLFTLIGGELTKADGWTDFYNYWNVGEKLKTTSGWQKEGNGTDVYGFSALPAGYLDSQKTSKGVGFRTCFWSSTETGTYNGSAYIFCMSNDSDKVYEHEIDKHAAYSVRCIKD